MAVKNEPVKGHAVDLLLECGHVKKEEVESAIAVPNPGEARYCEACKKMKLISKVGSIYWT